METRIPLLLTSRNLSLESPSICSRCDKVGEGNFVLDGIVNT